MTTDDVPVPRPLARGRAAAATYPAGRWRPTDDFRGKTRGWAGASCEWMDTNHAAMTGGSRLPVFSPEPYLTRLSYAVRSGNIEPKPPIVVVPTRDSVAAPRIPAFMEQLGALGLPIFPCVVAGHRYADGHLTGIGITGGEPEQLRAAAEELRRRSGMSVGPPSLTSRAQNPAYWQRSSTRWSSATPLRAFPDERVANWTVTEEAKLTGQLPLITWSKTPRHPWQRVWPQPSDGLGLWWAELEFEEPIEGPLQLGRTTEGGFGLFVPEDPR